MKIVFDGQVFDTRSGISAKTGKPWKSITLQDREGSQFSLTIPVDVKFPDYDQLTPLKMIADVKIGPSSGGGLYIKLISTPDFK
jgi:hypothetical protein